MPRIDPMKLLVCLSVLLAPNGGIRNAGEVRRLANLMAKFSKKLVSKAIYIQILKCTETELLGQFMQTGGWSLVHMWLVDGIGSKNWPLIQELMELLLCCPVDVERLKINSTPRLVKSLSTDSANESVKVLASKLVEQWLYIVKAPKQLSPMVPINQSELPAIAGLAGTADGKLLGCEAANNNASPIGASVGKQGGPALDTGMGKEHYQHNGYGPHTTSESAEEVEQTEAASKEDGIDGVKKSFQTVGESTVQPKKTSLVLKITTKNGKQVVAKVIKSTSKKSQRDSADTRTAEGEDEEADDDEEEDDDGEDQEEVVVNIESSKTSSDETVAVVAKDDQQDVTESKKLDEQNGREGSKERNSSSSKDKDRHHHSHRDRERDKDRKGSSSSRSSSSKSSSANSSSSSSKHKSSSSSSSKSSSSSSSRSKDKERHGSSSSSSSKHKSSSSSSSSKSSSNSKSSSGDKHRDRDKERSSSSGGGRDGKDSKNQSASPKLTRPSSRDDSVGGSNDSGSETSSVTNTSVNDTKVGKSATTIPSKKASISIEVRNPENRPKTVKTYNSQFRSHGLIEEAPPPPSRKGLKKPSSSSSPSTSSPSTASSNTSSTVIGSTAIGTVKRSSPIASGREAVVAGASAEKKAKEDPMERPGSIKLIPPKRQHALVESDMFMDALSATLRKDVKKRKRRTSGSESTATVPNSKQGETTNSTATAGAGSKSSGSDASTTKANAPGSPTNPAVTTEEHAAEATITPTTPTSPKVPTIAPMSFYRDTLAEQEEDNGTEATTVGEDGEKKDHAENDSSAVGVEEKKTSTTEKEDEPADDDDDEPIVKKPKRTKCELNEDEDEEKSVEGNTIEEKKVKKEPAEGETTEDDKTELMDVVMNDVEKKIAEEAEGVKKEDGAEKEEELSADGKKPPGPGCGPDGPPGVLVIHRRKGPKKQLRWRAAEELEEVRYFELDVTERCNVTKSFTDMKQMERVDERQKYMLSRKVASEDIMVERTAWRPLLLVDNVPPSPDGSQSLERNVQQQRERGCLQALYFNKLMIPDSPTEPDPADTYQTADPVHIPLEDVTGNPDSVNDFTSVPWPDPRSTPPHESAAFNSPFFPSDLPPGAGFGPGGFPPPFAPGAAASIGPGPWNLGPPGGAPGGGPRPGVLPPGMFPLNQPPPGLGQPSGGNSVGSPNLLNLPLSMSPNIPPPGMFPGANNFNAPPPELGLIPGGVGGPDMGGRRGDFRNGPPPHQQQWVTGGNRPFVVGGGGSNPPRGGAGGGFGNRGGGAGNWNNRNNGNNNGNRNGDRGRMGDDGRGNFRGHWLQGGNRGHNNNNRGGGGGGGRKW